MPVIEWIFSSFVCLLRFLHYTDCVIYGIHTQHWVELHSSYAWNALSPFFLLSAMSNHQCVAFTIHKRSTRNYRTRVVLAHNRIFHRLKCFVSHLLLLIGIRKMKLHRERERFKPALLNCIDQQCSHWLCRWVFDCLWISLVLHSTKSSTSNEYKRSVFHIETECVCVFFQTTNRLISDNLTSLCRFKSFLIIN